MNQEDKQELLLIAREAIKKSDIKTDRFKEKRGCFVTLTKKGELRGCIGIIEPIMSLGKAIVSAARSAAFSDPRFLPLQEQELKDIKIEISILSPVKEMKNKQDIDIGRDGLIIKAKGRSGLLLPQVAVEWKMDKKQFLEAVSEKAGLNKDSWKDKDARLFKFQVDAFSD